MKTAIIYATTHGTTVKAANYIAKNLPDDEVTLISIKEGHISPEQYDKVILGASIHMGVVSYDMKVFCKKNLDILKSKKIGLFVCGMEPNLDRQSYELEMAYPKALHKAAKARAFIGGEFLFEKMNFFQKIIIQKIAKTEKNVSQIHYDVLDHFISQMK